VIDNRAREQALVEIPALAVRTKETMRMHKSADRVLRSVEFGFCGVRLHQPERKGVAPGVIADPVPFGVRALGEPAVSRLRELLADHEEGRFDAAPREHV
jgi:hypothetical protein